MVSRRSSSTRCPRSRAGPTPAGKTGLRGETKHIRPVPDLLRVVVCVPFYGRGGGNRPDRNDEQVLTLIKQERMVIAERRRIRTCIADLHLVDLFRMPTSVTSKRASLTPLVETPPQSFVVVSLPIPMI